MRSPDGADSGTIEGRDTTGLLNEFICRGAVSKNLKLDKHFRGRWNVWIHHILLPVRTDDVFYLANIPAIAFTVYPTAKANAACSSGSLKLRIAEVGRTSLPEGNHI